MVRPSRLVRFTTRVPHLPGVVAWMSGMFQCMNEIIRAFTATLCVVLLSFAQFLHSLAKVPQTVRFPLSLAPIIHVDENMYST